MLSIIILAAGKGTRMHSMLPKVLQPLAGRPLLEHVINTSRLLDPDEVCIVYGFSGEKIQEQFRVNTDLLEDGINL